MKICIIGLTPPFRGGIAHYTALIAAALSKRHEVHVISLKRQYPGFLFPGRTQLDESGQAIGDRGRLLLDSINPLSWIRTGREIRKLDPDLCLFAWWNPFFAPSFFTAGGLGRLGRKCKVIFLCHNIAPHETTLWDHTLTRLAFRLPQGFIVHGSSDRERLLAYRKGAAVKVSPHPEYGVFREMTDVDRGEARRRLGLDGPVILFFGHVRAYKGLAKLIEAMPAVLAAMNCTLLVAGEFYEDRHPIDERIRELGIEDNLRIIDRYIPNEEVGLYFQAADVMVLPYEEASQSGAVQVGFGFDVPAIVTDAGGVAEAVEDGRTGLVVPAGDADALAGAVIRYFGEGLGEPFSRNIANRRERFDWQCMAGAIESLAGEIG